MNNKIAKTMLNLMPKKGLSEAAFWLSRTKPPKLVLDSFISLFSSIYDIDLDEIEEVEGGYKSFNEFFTRKLVEGARPIEHSDNTLVSPSDGVLSSFGKIDNLELEQIKGKTYSISALLDSDQKAESFINGQYATIYLSPKNYHRVHFPLAGEVTDFHYIPGELFPVNNTSVKSIKHLFSRNERLVTYLETDIGLVAIVMVAATCVSAITASYDPDRGLFARGKEIKEMYLDPIKVKKGEELGVFHMGSTVVMAFPEGSIDFEGTTSGQLVLQGGKIGKWKK